MRLKHLHLRVIFVKCE